MNINTSFKRTMLVASITAVLTACGGGSGGSSSSARTSTATATDTATEVEQSPLYLVKTTDWSTDEGTSVVFVTDSLDSETVFNPAEAKLVLPGYHYVSVNESADGEETAFHLAVDNTPTLQRYVVDEDGDVYQDGEMDFTQQGVTDMRNAMRAGVIFNAEKGYFVDFASLQIVVFNPTEMTLTETIDISDYAVEGYPERWSIYPVVDGDRVVAAMTHSITNAQGISFPAPVSHLLVIDTNDNSVTVDGHTACGGVSSSAKDDEGNVYFATHHQQSVAYTVGLPGIPTPCIIRMESGANGWDDSYYLDLTQLTDNNRPAYGLIAADGNKAYTLIYSDDAEPITLANYEATAWTNNWEFNSFELDNALATATKVEGTQPTNHRIKTGSFKNEADGTTPWVHRISADWSESTLYNATNTESWNVLTTIPGDAETVSRLR
ncbi:hypothetical protein HR060_09870 [Catenovulum sp. SM1970]|uniref:hypothetical protein n=1 Tax=Marinifaba aquimaris TaxID=2741323 RepID=UPI0015720BE6|nr:hypothetical protein [Marinifaba aquimaris]NTS77170.1 hypothetical protein [Marinifaba aquimaris]